VRAGRAYLRENECGTERAPRDVMSRELHCYQYVNRPFSDVREALLISAVKLFERHLHASFAGLDISKDIVVKVQRVEGHVDAPGHIADDAIRFDLEWRAEPASSMFPTMKAKLLAYAIGPNATQLDLTGNYEPPGGVVGEAADWLAGHRIAEESAKRFLDDVAGKLSEALA
jgi:hypothetical protein